MKILIAIISLTLMLSATVSAQNTNRYSSLLIRSSFQSYDMQKQLATIDTSKTDSISSYWLDNRNIFRDSYTMGKIFVDDFKYVYSSPVRLNFNSALWLAGITAVGGVIYAYDQEIHDAFMRNRDHKLYKPIRKLGENCERLGFMGFTNRFYIGAMALGYLIKYEPLVTIPGEILESHLIEGGAKNVANLFIGRHRPYEEHGPYFIKYNDGSSFPSGHAAVVAQVADVISYRIRFLPIQIGIYAVAGSVCFERITSEAHWPSDVYIAAVYGWAVSHAILKRHDRQRAKVAIGNVNGAAGLKFSFAFQ